MDLVPDHDQSHLRNDLQLEDASLGPALLVKDIRIAQQELWLEKKRRVHLAVKNDELSHEKLLELMVPEVREEVVAAGGWIKFCEAAGIQP